MAKSKIGILQGRLTEAAELQVFPVGAWKKEFPIASGLGLDALEWLLDGATGDKNPLWSARERERICCLSRQYNLPVATLCADYIQQSPLSVQDKDIRRRRVRRFELAMKCAAEIGVQCVLVPCFEEGLLPGTVFEDVLVTVLRLLCDMAQAHNIRLGLEMNWRAATQVALVCQVAHPALGIYYDLGNATAKGYDIVADIRTMGPFLVGIHIKDCSVGGGSVLLGAGDTRFEVAFAALQEVEFGGLFIFETPRGDHPIATVRRHLEFVKTLLQKVVE